MNANLEPNIATSLTEEAKKLTEAAGVTLPELMRELEEPQTPYMSESPAPYCVPLDGAQLAAEAALLATSIARVIPLRAEDAPAFAAAMIRHAQELGITTDCLTLSDILRLAPLSNDELAGAWYAIGKHGGAWYAVAPSTAADETPLVPVILGHRRRLIKPQDVANARGFITRDEAHEAGRKKFVRTFTLHLQQLAPL